MNPVNKQTGLSLIELMVAMIIGLFLTGGAITIYLQSGDTYRTTEKVARLQETARYAFEVIEPDIQHAGYWGTVLFENTSGSTGNVIDEVPAGTVTINCGANWLADAQNALEVQDNVPVATCTEPTRFAGGDALIIRRASRNVVAQDATRIQVESTRRQAILKFTATSPFAATPGISQVRNMIVHAYYVTQTGPTARPVFSLRRRALTVAGGGGMDFNPQTVIDGVQDIQIEVGVDTDSNGFADRYISAPAPAGSRVVAARVWLLVVADEPEAGFTDPAVYAYANRNFGAAFTDGRRRILVSRTIHIKNAHS